MRVLFLSIRGPRSKDSYFVDEMHPTYEGHRVIAGIILGLNKLSNNRLEVRSAINKMKILMIHPHDPLDKSEP